MLASRYSWTKQYCEESMYWEEFWDCVVMASNYTSEEKNAEYKLHYMLHADQKSSKKWKDLELPFPISKKEMVVKSDIGGVKQLQAQAPHFKVSQFPVRKKDKK